MSNNNTILICDDSLLVRKKLKDTINKLGKFNILEAVDGQAAIEKYKENRPDLVFLDIVMPNKNGIDTVKDIKKYDSEASVVILSSVGTQSNLKMALEAGAIDFIQKPWDDSQIDKLISSYLKGE